MPRRRQKRRGKAAMVPWQEAHAEIFRIAVGLTPPSHVRISQTLRGVICSAVFTNEDGRKITARTRVARSARTGELYLAEESLNVAMRVG